MIVLTLANVLMIFFAALAVPERLLDLLVRGGDAAGAYPFVRTVLMIFFAAALAVPDPAVSRT